MSRAERDIESTPVQMNDIEMAGFGIDPLHHLVEGRFLVDTTKIPAQRRPAPCDQARAGHGIAARE